MTIKARVFNREFKLQVLREIEAGSSSSTQFTQPKI